jgi:calcineurin-like phosphoesterase family protein
MKVWNKSHHGAWHLYGHSHGSLPDDINSLSFDVGVDSHDYKPISYEEVKRIMKKKIFKPLDHHGKGD